MTELKPGRAIGRWLLVEQLGRGRDASVFHCVGEDGGGDAVAVKFLTRFGRSDRYGRRSTQNWN